MSPKIFAFLAAGLALAQIQPAAAIECWTNNDGVRECGNVVPPEYAQKQVNTLNDRGLTVEVKERAKTREELAEERRRKTEEEHRQASEMERRKKQENRDRVLLSTFTTEEELIALGERQAAAIEASVEVTQHALGKNQESLQEYRKRVSTLERDNKPIPEQLQQDIASLEKQIADKQAYIAHKEEEKATLHRQKKEDLERFRYLKQRTR